jgi:hypothetical protein
VSVYTKLNDAREKFHALKLEKTGHNKFAGYKYFELGDFLIPALKVFKEVGLCAIVFGLLLPGWPGPWEGRSEMQKKASAGH